MMIEPLVHRCKICKSIIYANSKLGVIGGKCNILCAFAHKNASKKTRKWPLSAFSDGKRSSELVPTS